jgi:tetratricopeptide (TPR) repeat protein
MMNVPRFITGLGFLMTLMGIFSGRAMAQIINEVSLHSEKDNVVVTILLDGPVNYKRHFPFSRGKILDIYYDILDPRHSPTDPRNDPKSAKYDPSFDPWQDGEVRNSPPTSLIPSFTVKTNDQHTDQAELVIEFEKNAEYSVRPGDDGRSFLIYVHKIHPGEVGMQDLPEIAPAMTDDQKPAEALMMDGRDALQANDYAAAIEDFNKLLQLPPNAYTQDAQEWVGVARERAGQTDRARAEYESYLKLYSSGAGVGRVKDRLAKLPLPVERAVAPPARGKKPAQVTTYGNLSATYSRSAQADTVTSFLLTSVDLSRRYRDDQYDNRMVFRDSYTHNYHPSTTTPASKNKLTAAYFDVKNKMADFTARLGRQSANGGGVIGRFDGASVGKGLSSTWRIDGVAGQLSDSTLYKKPVFYGMKVDISGNAGAGWNGSFFAINQKVGGVIDRRAVGFESRYFDLRKNVYALLDYDTLFHVMNTAMLQGSVNSDSGTIFNFLLDHRTTVMTENIFTGASGTGGTLTGSPSALLPLDAQIADSGLTGAEVREIARKLTPTTNLAQVGITRPLDEKWQVGGDVKAQSVSRIECVDTSGYFCAPTVISEATGTQWGMTGQVIGNNIVSSQSTTLFSLGYMRNPAYGTVAASRAIALSASNRSVIHEKWILGALWNLYWEHRADGTRTSRSAPTVKLTYQARERLSFDAEAGIETNHVTNAENPPRRYFTLSFRGDF